MIGMAILGLVFLFFILVAVFAAKTWHVGHVIALAALFLFTLIFFVLSSATLATHARWREDYEQAKRDLATALQQQQQLQYGDARNEEEQTSLRGATNLVKRQLRDRGRIWRGLTLMGADPRGITLNTAGWANDNCAKGKDLSEDEVPEPVPDEAQDAPDDTAPATGVPHGITENTFVFAFKEYPIATLTAGEKQLYFEQLSEGEDNFADQDKRGRCRVPLAYMGKYRVAQSSENSVTLAWDSPATDGQPPLDEGQRNLLQDRGTWVLYEQLPQDAYDVFEGFTPEQLQTVFPPNRMQQMGLNLPKPRYDAMILRYLRDHKDAQAIDPPDRRWVEVKFVKPFKVTVDLEVEGEPPPADRPFAPGGRAQIPQLMQGKPGESSPTEFNEGDTVLLDFATANRLINEGICEKTKEVYVRSLRDYQFFYDDAQTRLSSLLDEMRVAQRDLNGLQEAAKQIAAQTQKYEAESVKLNQDLAGFQQELQRLGAYQDALQLRFDRLKSRIRRLLQSGTQAGHRQSAGSSTLAFGG